MSKGTAEGGVQFMILKIGGGEDIVRSPRL